MLVKLQHPRGSITQAEVLFMDEAPTLREAALIGAVLGITMLDNIEKEPTLDWLDEKRRGLLMELQSVERMIREKGGGLQVQVSDVEVLRAAAMAMIDRLNELARK